MQLTKMAWLALVLTSCGSGGVSGKDITGVWATYVVDAVHGDDANPGSHLQPFKTITHALTLALAGDHIQVLDGLYDAANGELFPLVIPASVEVRGHTADRGVSRILQGNALVPASLGIPNAGTPTRAAIVLRTNATIEGLEIKNWDHTPDRDVGVVMAEPGATVNRCRVRLAQDAGIWYVGTPATCRVLGSLVELNGIGLVVEYTGSAIGDQLHVQQSRFMFNDIGIELSDGVTDLGGGSLGSTGGNAIAYNRDVDLLAHLAAGQVAAQNNAWDHTPPSLSYAFMPPEGVDINTPTLGAAPANIDATGATIVTPE